MLRPRTGALRRQKSSQRANMLGYCSAEQRSRNPGVRPSPVAAIPDLQPSPIIGSGTTYDAAPEDGRTPSPKILAACEHVGLLQCRAAEPQPRSATVPGRSNPGPPTVSDNWKRDYVRCCARGRTHSVAKNPRGSRASWAIGSAEKTKTK